MIGFLAGHWHWLALAVLALAFAFAPHILLRFWREFMIVAGIIVAIIFWRDADQAHDALRERDLADAQSFANAQSSARSTEQLATQGVAGVDTTLQQEKRDGQAALADVHAARSSGDLRLRSEFQCPQAATVSDPATPARECDAEARAGFSPAHEDFLVRLAGEADDVARELTGCQATLRIYLEHFGEVPP